MAAEAPALSFPRDTFAKLSPAPFLLAHLRQCEPCRPSGRKVDEFRSATINTGSLSHSNGSAVVRVGDTAVVCGVRGEIMLASDIPHPPTQDASVEHLGLIVPNVELGTGCSPAHLPGNPPTALAQSLSHRLASLLHASHAIDLADLAIKYPDVSTDSHAADAETTLVTKAYWVLYVDILCVALDGNAFDAAWLAVTAALRDTTLPSAWWDPDLEAVLCSPLTTEGTALKLSALPSTSTFAVFTTASPLTQKDAAQSWVIADPDAFEEAVCHEHLTVVLASAASESGIGVIALERSGGGVIGRSEMRECIRQADKRRRQLALQSQSR